MAAAIPSRSSDGWLGCSRTAMVPGRPIVLRNRVTTRMRDAARIRSWLRMILLVAAAISGVIPGASAAMSVPGRSRCSRNSPTVMWAMGAKAAASWPSRIRRVTSSSS